MSSEERDPHFVLTLTRLHRLYTLSRAELLAELQAEAVPAIAALDALQDAFAAVAKIRFSFRSEKAAIEWVRTELGGGTFSAPTPWSIQPMSPADWEDVLRRANIVISPAPSPAV